MTPAQVAHIMPPLPKPLTLSRGDEDGAIQLGYTAEQMQAYARAAVEAALRDAPQVEGWVLVPVDVLKAASESLGSFVSDHGWGDADMQAMDNLDAYLAATPSAPTAVEPVPDLMKALPARPQPKYINEQEAINHHLLTSPSPTISDEEIAAAFAGTDFGHRNHRELLQASVLKRLVDYHCGHTITEIMKKMGLIGKTGKPTKRGIALVRDAYGHLMTVSG